MTQAERVLAAARSYRGTCQADWLADETPDGGPWITRVAARIQDLEDQGHEFDCIGVRNRTKVYRLVGEPSPVSGLAGRGTAEGARGGGLSQRDLSPLVSVCSPSSHSSEGRLFELPAVGHYQDEAA